MPVYCPFGARRGRSETRYNEPVSLRTGSALSWEGDVMLDIGGVEIPESLAKLAGEEAPASAEGNGRVAPKESAAEAVLEHVGE